MPAAKKPLPVKKPAPIKVIPDAHHLPNDTEGFSASDILSVFDDLTDLSKTVSEALGALRSKLKAVLDERSWDKTAIADLRKIHNMSATKRAAYRATFDAAYPVLCKEVYDKEQKDLLSSLDDTPSEETTD